MLYLFLLHKQKVKYVSQQFERLSRDVREQMITEAMYQLALTMPEDYAYQRGVYSKIENATTKYLEFL